VHSPPATKCHSLTSRYKSICSSVTLLENIKQGKRPSQRLHLRPIIDHFFFSSGNWAVNVLRIASQSLTGSMSISNLSSNDFAGNSTDAIGTKVFQHRCLFGSFSLHRECFSCDRTAESGPYSVRHMSFPQPELELADVGRGIEYRAGQGTGSDPLSSHPFSWLRCSPGSLCPGQCRSTRNSVDFCMAYQVHLEDR